jgi:hypothetical protein
MKPLFRLYGKKRGQRLAGWWLVGRMGEAFWFVCLCTLGVLSLGLVLGTNQFEVFRGFWLLVLISSCFIGIGAVGFIIRVLGVVYSAEYRSALANQNLLKQEKPRKTIKKAVPPMVPSLQEFTDSPGVRLAYRLPEYRPETRQLVLSSVFVLAWNALAVLMVGLALGGLFRRQPDWFLVLVVAPLFVFIGYRVSHWFFGRFRRAIGIGPTSVEIDRLPLLASGTYQLSIVQYGRLALKKLKVTLVCEESATYHFGTDTRTEKVEVYRQNIFEHGRDRIDWGRPLELSAEFRLPDSLMHSFQSPHNSITWKFLVEGDANRWPSYCRSFPVVVYPGTDKSPSRDG